MFQVFSLIIKTFLQVGMQLSELPKTSSYYLNKVVFYIHGLFRLQVVYRENKDHGFKRAEALYHVV